MRRHCHVVIVEASMSMLIDLYQYECLLMRANLGNSP